MPQKRFIANANVNLTITDPEGNVSHGTAPFRISVPLTEISGSPLPDAVRQEVEQMIEDRFKIERERRIQSAKHALDWVNSPEHTE